MSVHEQFEHLSAYLDGEVTAAERAAVEEHLAACSSCSETLEALRLTAQDLRALPEPALPELERARLRRAVARARRGRRIARLAPFAAAASLAGLAVVSVLARDPAPRDAASSLAQAPGSTSARIMLDLDEEGVGARLDELATLETGAALSGQSDLGKREASAEDAAAPECEYVALRDSRRSLTRIAFEHVMFKGEDAVLLAYRGDTHAEAWVFSPGRCTVLFFAQRAL